MWSIRKFLEEDVDVDSGSRKFGGVEVFVHRPSATNSPLVPTPLDKDE